MKFLEPFFIALSCALIVAVLFLAAVGAAALGDSRPEVPQYRLQSLQTTLDHERTLNWLLSRRLEREESGKQLNP